MADGPAIHSAKFKPQMKRKKKMDNAFRQKPRPSARNMNLHTKAIELTESRLRKAVAFVAKVENQCLDKNQNISRERIENKMMKMKGYSSKQCEAIFERYYRANSMRQIRITQGPPGFEITRDSGNLGAVVSKVTNVSLQNMGLRAGAVLYKIDNIFIERKSHEVARSLYNQLSFPAVLVFRNRSNLVKDDEIGMYSPRSVELRKDSICAHMQTLMKGFQPQELSHMSLSGMSQISMQSNSGLQENFRFASENMSTSSVVNKANSEDGDDSSDEEQYDFTPVAPFASEHFRKSESYANTPPYKPRTPPSHAPEISISITQDIHSTIQAVDPIEDTTISTSRDSWTCTARVDVDANEVASSP